MIKPNCRERLYTLLQRSDATHSFSSAGHGFKEAVKYLLPKLLLGPIYHCLHYFDVIKVHIPSLSLSLPSRLPASVVLPYTPPTYCSVQYTTVYITLMSSKYTSFHSLPVSLSLSPLPPSPSLVPPPYSSAHIPRSTLFDVITVQI